MIEREESTQAMGPIPKEVGKDNLCRSHHLVFMITFCAFILRMALSSHMKVINIDATGYFLSGVKLFDYLDDLSGFWSPLYPILSVLVNHTVNDIELAGKIVGALAGSGLVWAVYLFSRRLYGEISALVACVITAYMPVMVYYSTFVTPEMTYLFFSYVSLALFLKWVQTERKKYCLLSGLACSWAYLSRPEGFLLFCQLSAICLLFIAAKALKFKERVVALLVGAGLFVSAFALSSAPYLVLVRSELGFWSISGRAGSGLMWVPEMAEESLHRLSDDKTHVIGPRDMGTVTLLGLAIKEPEFLVWKYKKNLRELIGSVLPRLFINTYVLGFLLVILGVGLVMERHRWLENVFVLSLALPMLITPLYVVEVRVQTYLVPVVAVLVGMTSGRLGYLKRVLERLCRMDCKSKMMAPAAVSLIVVTILSYFAMKPEVERRGSYGLELKEAGLWLKEHGVEKGPVIDRKGWVAYYSGQKKLAFPYAEFDDVMFYAASNKAKYLVMDDIVTSSVRPKFAFLLDQVPPGVELLYDNHGVKGKRVAIFRFKSGE